MIMLTEDTKDILSKEMTQKELLLLSKIINLKISHGVATISKNKMEEAKLFSPLERASTDQIVSLIHNQIIPFLLISYSE